MAKSAQQPVKAIPARPRLVAEVQPLATTPKPCRKLDHNVSPVLDYAVMSHLTAPPLIGNRNRYRRFVHIKSNVTYDRFHLARLPCIEALRRLADGLTLDDCMS